MRNVQQGTIPLDILAYELPDIPLPVLEVFLTAATKGKLSTRNRAVAVMSYVRESTATRYALSSKFLPVRFFRTGNVSGDRHTEPLHEKAKCDKQSNDEAVKSEVFALLHSPPSAHSVNRTTWTIAIFKSLSQGKHPAGAESIRTIIKESASNGVMLVSVDE